MAPAGPAPHLEPVQHHFESQRLRLAYWEWGSAEAPPLVLLHGKRDHARSLDRLAAAFCDDYRVIAPDLRGHGDSDWAVGGYYGMSEHVADLLALIDVIGGRADIVGHSFGSRIALYAAGALLARHGLAAGRGVRSEGERFAGVPWCSISNMELSLSLPHEDVEFIDRYLAEHDEASRSEVVRKALALLRERELGDAYQAAWEEWVEDGEDKLWDLTVGDGIEPEDWSSEPSRPSRTTAP